MKSSGAFSGKHDVKMAATNETHTGMLWISGQAGGGCPDTGVCGLSSVNLDIIKSKIFGRKEDCWIVCALAPERGWGNLAESLWYTC